MIQGSKGLEQIYENRWDPLGNVILGPGKVGYTGYAKIKIQTLRTICRFVNGWVIQAKTFNLKGQLLANSSWKAGKQNGYCTIWYENGQKKSDETFVDGLRDGLLSVWHENGQKKAEVNWQTESSRDLLSVGIIME